MEMTQKRLSCEEIYSRIVRGKDPETGQTVYYYYLVPFKEKVFFYAPKGFTEAFNRGEVNEVILRPDFTNPKKCIFILFKTYSGYVENRLEQKNTLQKARYKTL